MAEGLRSMDLHRWRSMDQMITKPYHILGMNLWQEMYGWDWYKDSNGNSILKEGENVSSVGEVFSSSLKLAGFKEYGH